MKKKKERKGAKEQRKSTHDNHADDFSEWQRLRYYDKS